MPESGLEAEEGVRVPRSRQLRRDRKQQAQAGGPCGGHQQQGQRVAPRHRAHALLQPV